MADKLTDYPNKDKKKKGWNIWIEFTCQNNSIVHKKWSILSKHRNKAKMKIMRQARKRNSVVESDSVHCFCRLRLLWPDNPPNSDSTAPHSAVRRENYNITFYNLCWNANFFNSGLIFYVGTFFYNNNCKWSLIYGSQIISSKPSTSFTWTHSLTQIFDILCTRIPFCLLDYLLHWTNYFVVQGITRCMSCRRSIYSSNFCNCLLPDLYMDKARRQYSEGVGRRHMHQLRDDLNDVQRIMMDNIDDVLQRGTALHGQEQLQQLDNTVLHTHGTHNCQGCCLIYLKQVISL